MHVVSSVMTPCFDVMVSCICRLAAVHLVDAHLCTDPAKYISALLLSLSTMLHLELPHVNILSKIDLIEQYGKLQFNLDFYTEVSCLPAFACDHDYGTVSVTLRGTPFGDFIAIMYMLTCVYCAVNRPPANCYVTGARSVISGASYGK